jgi:hypothetical protein
MLGIAPKDKSLLVLFFRKELLPFCEETFPCRVLHETQLTLSLLSL